MDGQRMFALIEKLNFVRVSGTPGEEEAARILLRECEALGLDACIDSFATRDGQVLETALEVTKPYHQVYEASALRRSASACGAAKVIYAEDALPANLVDAEGAILIINTAAGRKNYEALLKAKPLCVLQGEGDAQDRPEEIPNLYRKAQEGYDYVIASRKSRRDSGLKKFFSGCFYSLYSYMTGVKFDPSLCGFSICSRKVIDEYCGMRELHRAFTMYLLWMGYHWTTVSVDHDERYEGKSGYSFRKKMRMATEVITSQSDKLLRLVTRMGIAIALLAFLLIIVSVVLYFTLDTQPGYTSTIAMIMLMGGLTIMAVGIAGLYIGNIFMEVKQRPLYIVRTILNKKEEEK